MFESLMNTILARGMRLRRIRKRLQRSFMSEMTEGFLILLLRGMRLMFFLDRGFRRNIQDFRGRYFFRSLDDSITVFASFDNGRMTFGERNVSDADVTITFRDDRALRDFLLAEKPDLLNALLTQSFTVDGNLNYIYKFGYMANHLRLTLTA